MIRRSRTYRIRPSSRRGTIVPIVAATLLVVLAVLALVVDRLWLDAVHGELRNAAEAAALAGARGLADDDRLKPNQPAEAIAKGAAWMATKMAGQCQVGGRPLDLDMDRDVTVGAYAESATTGERGLLTNVDDPRTVVVRPAFLKSRNNPLALLMRGLHGPDVAEMIYRAEATVDNRIDGVRPLDGTAIPAMPLAILLRETTSSKRPDWITTIEQRGGNDQYGYDLETHRIIETPDGIPEIELTAAVSTGDDSQPNLAVLGLGNQLQGSLAAVQFKDGLRAEDLERTGGELAPDRAPFEIGAKQTLTPDELNALEALRGEVRIVLLYSEIGGGNSSSGDAYSSGTSTPRVRCERLVAGRVLAVHRDGASPPRLIFQPGVVATRTALRIANADTTDGATTNTGSINTSSTNTGPSSTADRSGNKYIYHLGLSR